PPSIRDPEEPFSRPVRTQALLSASREDKVTTPHVRRISKAHVYKLASIGTLLRNSGTPAGVRSEFRHAQVRLRASKISNSVRIAARSSKNRKGHVRKSNGTIEPSTTSGCSNWAKLIPCRPRTVACARIRTRWRRHRPSGNDPPHRRDWRDD